MKLKVLNIKGETTSSEVELPDDIFGIEPNEHALYLATKQYLAHQRQGTAKSKDKGEVTASTRKIKRQKGTGTARAGSVKSGIMRGGGRFHGPRPRTYTLHLNKKVKTLARKSALSGKAQAKQIIVVEDFDFETPKTSEYVNILNSLNVADKKTLHVTAEMEQSLVLSSRNLKKAVVSRAQDLNTYGILNSNCLILSVSAIEKIKESFA